VTRQAASVIARAAGADHIFDSSPFKVTRALQGDKGRLPSAASPTASQHGKRAADFLEDSEFLWVRSYAALKVPGNA
jgi:hypothetical protein